MNKQIQRTSVERVSICVDRIHQLEPAIQAWEFLDRDAALQAAMLADQTHVGKLLYGWVVGVKDNCDTGDMPTGYGSLIYQGHRPASDSAVVTRLRASGAIVLGKTVATEFAAWPPSRTRNPRNPDYSPGGSSSGSAAAVASGMVPAAIGTQTLGSVIRPASYCGVVAFKPSYGRISRVGIRPLADSLDTVGMFGNSVADVACLYVALSDDAAAADPAPVSHQPRFAFCKGPAWSRCEVDAQAAVVKFIAELRGRGCPIDDLELPASFDALPAAAKLIHDFEMRNGFLTEYLCCPDKLSRQFREGFERAGSITIADYERAIMLGESCRQQLHELARDKIILGLAATGEAPIGNTTTGDSVMNAFWTLLHAPCITLPKLTGRSGLPIGLQVIAPRFQDTRLIHAAQWLETF